MKSQLILLAAAILSLNTTVEAKSYCDSIRRQMLQDVSHTEYLNLSAQYRECLKTESDFPSLTPLRQDSFRSLSFIDSSGKVRRLQQTSSSLTIDGVDLTKLSAVERARRIQDFERDYNLSKGVPVAKEPVVESYVPAAPQARDPLSEDLIAGDLDESGQPIAQTEESCHNQLVVGGQTASVCAGSESMESEGSETSSAN